MVIGTALDLDNVVMVILSIVLAFVFGYALTFWSVMRTGVSVTQAIGIAASSDTMSITSMEAVDNLVVIFIPGALDARLDGWLFWMSLVLSLLIAFVVTVPVNRWLIARGVGHTHAAQVHRHDPAS